MNPVSQLFSNILSGRLMTGLIMACFAVLLIACTLRLLFWVLGIDFNVSIVHEF